MAFSNYRQGAEGWAAFHELTPAVKKAKTAIEKALIVNTSDLTLRVAASDEIGLETLGDSLYTFGFHGPQSPDVKGYHYDPYPDSSQPAGYIFNEQGTEKLLAEKNIQSPVFNEYSKLTGRPRGWQGRTATGENYGPVSRTDL